MGVSAKFLLMYHGYFFRDGSRKGHEIALAYIKAVNDYFLIFVDDYLAFPI